MPLDSFTHAQLIASAELAFSAALAGMLDVGMLYVPGDAPAVTRKSLKDKWEISTDGRGTFDVWSRSPLKPVKFGLTLDEAVAFLRDATDVAA